MMAHPEAPRDQILNTWQWISLLIIVLGGMFAGISYIREAARNELDTVRREMKIVSDDMDVAVATAMRQRENAFLRVSANERAISSLRAQLDTIVSERRHFEGKQRE